MKYLKFMFFVAELARRIIFSRTAPPADLTSRMMHLYLASKL
jgi:hypothetical protein